MSGGQEILIERDQAVLHIRFNRPERHNALTEAMLETLLGALDRAQDEPGVRVVVLSGEGASFCAGVDLRGASSEPSARYRHRQVDLEAGPGPLVLHDCIRALRGLAKPTVALLHGNALGAGYDLALACDIRIGTEDCRFGDPRVHRALWAAEGWSYLLPRLIPAGWTSRLALLGDPFDGREALAAGLLHRMHPSGADLRSAASVELAGLARLDPAAFRWCKEAIFEGADLSYDQSLRRL
ncbi:MAG: enoyl-CoA hydratase/isomerase family protein [Acidimicrobiales bacterium]